MGRLVTETGITRAVVTSRIGEQTYFPEIVRMDILSAGYITVPGDINCINLSADRVVGKWDGNTLDSYQVNIEGIDIKSTGIDKDLFLKTTGDGRVVWDPTPFADTVGNVDGSGTANTLAKFTDSDTIGDSIVTENGSVVTVAGSISATTDTYAGGCFIGSCLVRNGDNDTYFSLPGTDTVNMVAGGKSAIKLDYSATDPKIQLNNSNDDIDVQIMADDGSVILHTDAGTNNVGIGTSTPGVKLEVNGDGCFQGSLSVHGDMHYLDTAVTVTSALSVTNAGTGPALTVCQEGTEPIAHFVDKDGGEIMFADTGEVGIGTASPSKSLDIHSGTGDDGIRLYSTGSGGRAVAELQIDSVSNGNADFRLYCATNITTRITTNAGNPTYFNAGNVGIGTSTPGEKLTVSGNISACGGLSAHNGYFADNVGIGTNTPTKELEVTGTIFGTTQVCSPAVCGSTSVCGALISDGSSCLDGSGNVCGSYGYFDTQVCGSVVTDGYSCLDGGGNVCGSYGYFDTQVCGSVVTDGYSCFDGSGNVCGSYGCFSTQVCGSVVTDGYSCFDGSGYVCANYGICSTGDICATSNTVCAYNLCASGGTVCGYYGCFSYVYKSSSTFHIDHPLESKKDTHSLVHSVIEGPKADNIYSGVVQLTAGSATINIDNCANMTEGTFVALNRCIRTFANNESNWDLVRSRVSGNIVTVESCVSDSTADVSWMVIGERQDVAMTNPGNPMTDSDGHIIVEPEKPALSGEE